MNHKRKETLLECYATLGTRLVVHDMGWRIFLGTLMPKGPDHEKVGTWPIFNVNTPFQWHISTLSSLEKILLFILYRQ